MNSNEDLTGVSRKYLPKWNKNFFEKIEFDSPPSPTIQRMFGYQTILIKDHF